MASGYTLGMDERVGLNRMLEKPTRMSMFSHSRAEQSIGCWLLASISVGYIPERYLELWLKQPERGWKSFGGVENGLEGK